jgi:hypothetical protein
MKHIKPPLFTSFFLVILSIQTYASDAINSYLSDAVVEKYQNNQRVTFESFHDQYLLLRRLQFPNIYKQTMKKEEFDNPQKLLKYMSGLEKSRQKDIKPQVQLTTKVVDELEKHPSIRNEQKLKSFTKNGYYLYFKTILSNNNASEYIRIYIEIDDSQINHRAEKSYAEINAEYQSIFQSIIYSLNPNDYMLETTEVKFGSYVEIHVNESALNSLYTNSLVQEINHPETVRTNPMLTKGR